MNYKVIYGKNDLVYTGFLALPGKLYQKNELTQDYDTEYKPVSYTHLDVYKRQKYNFFRQH